MTVDLQGWTTYAPDNAQWGQTINIQSQVRNAGSGTAAAFQVQWYLSRDSLGSSDDILLRHPSGATGYGLPSIAANGYSPTFYADRVLPSALPSGWSGSNFHVIMKTDSANNNNESNENNNFGQIGNSYDRDSITITTPPSDLQGWSTYAPDNAQWGQTINIQTQVRNAGSGAAAAFQVEWYLSQDNIGGNGNDILLAHPNGATSYVLPAIAANGYSPTFYADRVLPSALPSGWSGSNFHVIMKTDSANNNNESNENNNFGQIGNSYDRDSITITTPVLPADLKGEWVDAQNTAAQWGQTAALTTVQVRNAGTGAAGAFQVQWYISRDQYGDTGDILLAQTNGATSFSHQGIAANSLGSSFSVNLKLPNALPSGWSGNNFYVVMKTDSASQVQESNESNNFGGNADVTWDWDTITITTPISGPANNNFTNRSVVVGTSVAVTGTNVNATKEISEPNHAGISGGKSVWWTWTAPSSGVVQIDTIGSNFDTILGVYTGSNVSALTTIAGNDDSDGSLASKVSFSADRGTAYQIAVDGYNAQSGNITLHVSPISLRGIVDGHPLPGLLSQIEVTLSRFGDGGAPIDPARQTWIIIHGRESSSTATNIRDLATAVGNYSTTDQLLTLDWSQGAWDNSSFLDIPLQGERWIANVAAWTASRLRDLSIPASRVRLIGHSWGAHVANEIARNMANAVPLAKVKAIVALDPATLADRYTGGTPNFSLNSSFSWAFNSSLALGNNAYALTATESFDVTVGDPATIAAHSNVVDLFARMTELNTNTNQTALVSSRFSLTRLLSPTPVPWANTSGFEGFLYATQVTVTSSDGRSRLRWEPISLSYGSTPPEFVSPDLAGNSMSQARDIGVLSGSVTYRDWVGSLDPSDYYRFSLPPTPATRTLTLTLTGLSADTAVAIYNSSGGLAAYYPASSTSLSISLGLLASNGPFYVRVLRYSAYANTYYTLTINV